MTQPRTQSRRRQALNDQQPIMVDAYHQVKARLNDLVERLAAEGEYRLPAEDQLSSTLGVSRPTVRSALLSLQKEGKVSRFHGRGTFINKYALTMGANLAEDLPFVDLIANLGYTATLRTLAIGEVTPEAEIAAKLDLEEGGTTCTVDRIFEADGRPAVLSRDYVPVSRLLRPVEQVTAEDSTFAFVERNVPGRIQYSIADLVPAAADERTSEHLGVPAGRPMLLIRHLHLDEKQEPVAVTDALVDDEILRFSIVRTYLD
ncbi:GntR family transcriptional regulator [Nocardioides soli]|uniref:GntR family transcriptional regulator n=1 Tax=Nocardioides soli TaxID=1036020 RepID=A0A7W4VU26_9ACTN|nr:GntR family transcriptional regulator [Nocardioides soli]MBB3041769.1 GntR family transcriptional regulator [Nocardioides soli]